MRHPIAIVSCILCFYYFILFLFVFFFAKFRKTFSAQMCFDTTVCWHNLCSFMCTFLFVCALQSAECIESSTNALCACVCAANTFIQHKVKSRASDCVNSIKLICQRLFQIIFFVFHLSQCVGLRLFVRYFVVFFFVFCILYFFEISLADGRWTNNDHHATIKQQPEGRREIERERN